MSKHLYLVVSNRNSEIQNYDCEWGMQGKLIQLQVTDDMLKDATEAMSNGSRVFIYEVNCKKPLKSHISQEVRISEVRPDEKVILFSDHNLIYRKGPFVANQKALSKWHPLEPTERVI